MRLSAPENGFQYRGDLAQTTLPEILSTVDRFQVPGVIEASRDGVVKQVFIKEGNVIHATSSDRDDSLGSFLRRTGVLTPEAYLETMREREQANKRYGVLLIEKGLLSPAEIRTAIRRQIESIVWSLFSWDEGRVRFSIGDFREPDTVRIQLPMRHVILQGIKRAQNAKAMVARLGRKETVFEPCYRSEELIEAALDAADMKLLALVNGKRTLYDICAEGPHAAAENGKLLYAFQVLRLVRGLEVAQEPATASAPAALPETVRPEPVRPAEARTAGTSTGAIKIRFKTEGDKFSF